MKLLPEIMWKEEHVSDELAYLIKETSKQIIEVMACFLLFCFVLLLIVKCERKEIIKGRTVKP